MLLKEQILLQKETVDLCGGVAAGAGIDSDGEERRQMDLLSSNSLLLMEKSMGFLWTKQAAILDNIANAETPNYKPKVVTFEESLRARLEDALGERKPVQAVRSVLGGAEPVVEEAEVSTRMDDNGVNVTEQSVELVRNAYQLQYIMSAINSDLTILRTAVRGQ